MRPTLVNASEGDPVAQVMELSGGRGADVAFEVIGLGPTIEQTFQMTRRGGQAIIVGVPAFDVTMTITPAMDLLFQEKQIRGCVVRLVERPARRPDARQALPGGQAPARRADLAPRSSSRQVNEALDNMGSGEIARSVIKY